MTARDIRLMPLALNAIGMAVVLYAFFSNPERAGQQWLVAATIVAVAAWAVMQGLQQCGAQGPYPQAVRWARRSAGAVGVVVTSLAQTQSAGTLTAPLAIILVLLISDEQETIWVGAAASVLAFALTAIGVDIAGADTATTVGFLAGTAVWVLIGISRRQARQAARSNRELLVQQQEAHAQEARAATLAARQAAARDIHDVLAHSLGGLVIQLDAAEALLDSGRTHEAGTKVAQARALAAGGLAEARRAVEALRSPEERSISERGPADLTGAAERLFRAHRELGGEVDAHLDLHASPGPLPAPLATAFERALQEAMSNARRHAPHARVSVELVAADGRIALTVSNPIAADRPRSEVGGGNGLTGMAERFAALDGGSATAAERDGHFVVSVSARITQG